MNFRLVKVKKRIENNLISTFDSEVIIYFASEWTKILVNLPKLWNVKMRSKKKFFFSNLNKKEKKKKKLLK